MRLYIGNKGITAYPYDGCKPFEANRLGVYYAAHMSKPPMTLTTNLLRMSTTEDIGKNTVYRVSMDGVVDYG